MHTDFSKILTQPDDVRLRAYEETADRLGTEGRYVEKDLWVCLVLHTLYNLLPQGHPSLLFKGGTALSKAGGLISRFSEDIDIVVFREWLGYAGEGDPANSAADLSNTRRRALLEEMEEACGAYVHGKLADDLAGLLPDGCRIVGDGTGEPTLLVEYPTLYPAEAGAYVLPQVKIESGARSALDPNTTASVRPYVADDVEMGQFLEVPNIKVIEPTRTYLDKAMILHGFHCGSRDLGRPLRQNSRQSRHYYDIAMMAGTEIAAAASADRAMLEDVRLINKAAFPAAWKKLDEAVPGTIRLAPTKQLIEPLKEDYESMRGMIFGDVPEFDWILERVRAAEELINAA